MIFCDTSTAAKLYVPESDSGAVREVLESAPAVALSELARAELMGVFHRRLREGTWRRSDFELMVRQFNADDVGGFWTWLPLDERVTKAAAQAYVTLPEGVFLRTADCIHLVTAQVHDFDAIYTHDRHQALAAIEFGLNVVQIGS